MLLTELALLLPEDREEIDLILILTSFSFLSAKAFFLN